MSATPHSLARARRALFGQVRSTLAIRREQNDDDSEKIQRPADGRADCDVIRDFSVARHKVARRIFAQHLDIIQALGRGSSEQEFRIYLVFPDPVADTKRSAW